MLENGTKIEIKTARKGKKIDTFQFNGINPRYTPNFIIFVGILENDLLYRILSKSKISYVQKKDRNKQKTIGKDESQ